MIERGQVYALIEHQQGGVTAGDTLKVAAGDVAVFARRGTLVRVLQAGSYQVPAEFAGPDMEVYFVSTRPHHDEKFGGNLSAGLPVRAAFGKFTWRIADPERAVAAVGGGDELRRFVAAKVTKAAQFAAMTTMRDGWSPEKVQPLVAPEANGKLADLGIEVMAVTELTMR